MNYEMSKLRGVMGYHEFIQYVTSCELDDFEDVMEDIFTTLVFIDSNRNGRFQMSDIFALLGRMNPTHFRGRVKIWEEIYEAFHLISTLEEDFKKNFIAESFADEQMRAFMRIKTERS